MTDWTKLYKTLKERDIGIYKKAIEYGDGLATQHNLSPKAAADVETAFVIFALELTGGLS